MQRFTIALLALGLVMGCASKEDTQDTARATTASTRAFQANHRIEIKPPEGASTVRAWLAIPDTTDPHQQIRSFEFKPDPSVANLTQKTVQDQLGNRFQFIEATGPFSGPIVLTTNFEVVRQEVIVSVDPKATRPHTAAELAAMAEHLAPGIQEVIDDDIRAMAAKAVGDEKNPILIGRKLYDAVLEHVEYHVKDPKPDAQKTLVASGKGSTRFAYEQCTGNCTDFHALYISLARAAGLPSRIVYGSFFKTPLDGQDKDQSYHCWVEFHAPNIGWVPLDVAVADVYVADFQANEHSRPRVLLTTADGFNGPDAHLVDYYFGNLEARRVVWHRGRDLMMIDPPQAGAPLPWLFGAYVEADGKPIAPTRKLTFRELR